MSNSFKARLIGALFGSSLVALFIMVFWPEEPLCLPISFLGGIIGIILGALINNVYLNRPKTLSHSVNWFRALGFFLEKGNYSDEKLAELIILSGSSNIERKAKPNTKLFKMKKMKKAKQLKTIP